MLCYTSQRAVFVHPRIFSIAPLESTEQKSWHLSTLDIDVVIWHSIHHPRLSLVVHAANFLLAGVTQLNFYNFQTYQILNTAHETHSKKKKAYTECMTKKHKSHDQQPKHNNRSIVTGYLTYIHQSFGSRKFLFPLCSNQVYKLDTFVPICFFHQLN